MINRGETEPVVTEQSSPVKSSDKVAATPDVKKDVEEKKQKDKEKSKAETIGTTYTSSSLYDSLKSPDEKIFNAAAKYLYDKGIIRTEWGDQKPLFDFVRYHSGGNSSAFGPGQIVYSTAQKMLDNVSETLENLKLSAETSEELSAAVLEVQIAKARVAALNIVN